MRIWVMTVFTAIAVSGCAAERTWAPDEAVAQAAYVHDGPPQLTLFTMLNNKTGAGAHSSLMINGSQRVAFDPAGSFRHDTIPERNDVLYGMSPAVVDVYTRYHARKTFHVKIQTLDVPPEMAERAMAAARTSGPVPQAFCARSTSTILAGLFPGQVSTTWSPKALSDQFGTIPGVTETELYEYDSDDNSKVLEQWDPSRI